MAATPYWHAQDTADDAALHLLAESEATLAQQLREVLAQKATSVSSAEVDALVQFTLWGLSLEPHCGRSLSLGYALLLGEVDAAVLNFYAAELRRAAVQGTTLASQLAPALAQVLKTGRADLLSQFQDTLAILLSKGAYLLPQPLAALTRLLAEGDFASVDAAGALLALLTATFRQELTYNQSKYLGHKLPELVLALPPAKRVWQTRLLTRLVARDVALADAFAEGLERGLKWLNPAGLEAFVDQTLQRHQPAGVDSAQHAVRFLALTARAGQQALGALRTCVPLTAVQTRLSRYLKARTGLNIQPRAFSQLSAAMRSSLANSRVASDGLHLYLPDEIDDHNSVAANTQLYLTLTRLEAACYEWGTFDLELAALPWAVGELAPYTLAAAERQSELEWFWNQFPEPQLAEDLFTIFEHGRLWRLMGERYPGQPRALQPSLWQAMQALHNPETLRGPQALMPYWYATIALDMPANEFPQPLGVHAGAAHNIVQEFSMAVSMDATVATSAHLLHSTYARIAAMLDPLIIDKAYIPLKIPFGRRLHPWLHWQAHRRQLRLSLILKKQLEQQGLSVYRYQIQKQLAEHAPIGSEAQLLERLQQAVADSQTGKPSSCRIDAGRLDLQGLFTFSHTGAAEAPEADGAVHWYAEWDVHQNDYLEKHVRVLVRPITASPSDFYARVCGQYAGLMRQVRHAFERLKPRGLVCLRHWPEGDELDYHALLTFVTERRAGPTAAEGLYLKRLKHTRAVAVLLLVDLSRSTTSRVTDGGSASPSGQAQSVLDVTKEALVLFCEALNTVGDDFAISGFSGNGRLAVDYYALKEFGAPLNAQVKDRIAALAPRRNTRMGAAIRHATQQLAQTAAAARLLIVLSDGFPNDLGYKQGYALADTRRALLEAGQSAVQTHAIILNIAVDAQLQALYGATRLSVITNVRELPSRLLRIYGRLAQ